MISVCEIDDGEDGDDEMDWEVVADENEASASNAKVGPDETEPTVNAPSLRLECIDGPHRGESFELTGTLVLGRDPAKNKGSGSSKSQQVYAVGRDDKASSSHAKLVLNSSGSKKNGVLMVKVFDLKSANGTLINTKVLPKGTSRQAFVKDRIQVGESVFRILKN